MKANRLSGSFARALAHRTEIIMVADHPEHGIIAMGSAGGTGVITAPIQERFIPSMRTLDSERGNRGKLCWHIYFGALAQAGHDSAVIWVLAPNPSRFFYERMGGQRAVQERGEKRLQGTTLQEWAYGWTDLKKSSVISDLGFTVPEHQRSQIL